MVEQTWKTLHDKIYRQPPAGEDLVSPPTDESLDAFESELSIRLPASYRAFIKLFGPGELADQYLIFAPGCVGNPTFDMTRFNRDFRKAYDKSKVLQKSYTDPQLIRRLVFFCRTIDNDYYGWDPDAVSDKSTFEMPVHQLIRLRESTSIVGATFYDFVVSHCLSKSESGSFVPARVTPQGRKGLAKSNKPSSPKPSKNRSGPKKRPKK